MVHSLLKLSERWLCHIRLVDKMKMTSLEASLCGESGPLSISHSFHNNMFSLSLSLVGVPT